MIFFLIESREASGTDGKAQNNLAKLQLFREFYIMVVTYVYFTRIVVYLLEATIPFYLYWFGELFTELATFLFFIITGYKFRPMPDNPYFHVPTDEAVDGDEYGLEDGTAEEEKTDSKQSRKMNFD